MQLPPPFFAPSTFIVDQNPQKYGGRQEDYKRLGNIAIGLAMKKLEACPKDKDELTKLFFEILEDFGKCRSSTALSHNTFHAEQFGRRRDVDGHHDFYLTALDDVYKSYNTKFLKWIATILSQSNMNKKDHPKIQFILESSSGDCKSSFEIEIIEKVDIDAQQWNNPIDINTADLPLALIEKREKEKGLDPVFA